MYQKPYHEDGFDCTYGGETLCSACEENESEREFIDQTANDLIYKFKYYPKTVKGLDKAIDQARVLSEGYNYDPKNIPCEDWHTKIHNVLRKHEAKENTWRGLAKDEIPNKDDMHEIQCEVCGWTTLYEDYLKDQL